MHAKSSLFLAILFIVGCSGGVKQGAAGRGGGPSAVDLNPSLSAGAGGASEVKGDAGATSFGGDTSADALIVPTGMNVTPRIGNNSVFKVIALTLRAASSGAELFAAVRNDGDILACNPSFSVELRDQDDQTLAAGISGLMERRFYRFTDGSDTIAACVAPGDVTMVAITSLSLDSPMADVRSVVYQSSYWGNLDVVAIPGVNLSDVNAVNRGDGVAYTGSLVNALDKDLSGPTVAVFPLNAVGRPLEVAYGGSSVVLAPGAAWDFETSTVGDAGEGFDAYPMGGP